ncbi:MAG: Gx transporter family protein [Clostridia bacterium]|nr:Gx transporter family protein [Clostridia bacterium]
MSSKQSDNRNRVTAVCIYALFCCACLIFGYVESVIPTTLIAPGVKLGLSNSVAILLLINKDIKGAFAVNTARILLSALLFGSPFSLLFSLTAGVISIIVSALSFKIKALSPIGVSIIGAVTHNIVQIIIACFVVSLGCVYYLPILVVSGVVTGGAIGFLAMLLFEKLKKIL